MKGPPTWPRRRWVFLSAALLGALAAALGIAYFSGVWTPDPSSPPEDPFPIPPLSASLLLNTGPDASYVGSESCRKCHEDRHASFRHTGMGRSMAEVDLAREPPDATFDHPVSKRRYDVRRRDGQLWHREFLLIDGSADLLLTEHPLKYVTGSGRHSLTYLAEIDGFLVESPVTWYTSRKAWGMSPGYDSPEQMGFGRSVGEGCLQCHAGRNEPVGQALHKMRIHEAAIGCEQCHGPGSLHVAARTADAPASKPRGSDPTIANPARMTRELAEAVCSNCHLRTHSTVLARGHKPADFRPGLPLQDVRADYWLDVAGTPMTVVGHVDQMHVSKCYEKSTTLTCTTCHDPHAEPEPEKRVEYYKAVCLTCHKPEHCKVPADRRVRESPSNDCVKCHMPMSPTDIPHLAFTHHRIGHHDKPPPADRKQGGAELRPFLDLSRLSDIDRRRSLGLANVEAASRETDRLRALWFREEALTLLDSVRKAGLKDPSVDATLARFYHETGRGEVVPLAEGVLTHANASPHDRINALLLLARVNAGRGRHAEAADAVREVTTMRRNAVDWVALAEHEGARGNEAGRVEALAAAVRINPRMWQVHQLLAQAYRQRGDAEKATYHQKRAVR